MRASRFGAYVLASALVSAGCASLELSSKGSDGASFSAPAEDGSRYVSVEGGAWSTEKKIARRWEAAAQDACDGDYIVLSDASFTRRDREGVERRLHEGFVRCVAPAE
jgi:hypothetical protein